MGSYLVAALPS